MEKKTTKKALKNVKQTELISGGEPERRKQAAVDNSVEWFGQEQYQQVSGIGRTTWQAMKKKEPALFRNGRTHERLMTEFWRRNPNFKREEVYGG